MRGRIATLLAVIAFATMGAACRTAVAPPAQTLPPVALPDLSALAPSVQQQVRASHGDLTRAIAANKPPADLAAAYGALGRVLMAARFSDEAILCYQHAAALAGTDPRWSYYLGHAYLRKGDRAAAARAFERAVALAPADVNALVWLGETYLDDSRLDDAQSAFARALAVQPQSAAALFGAGRVALARRSYPEAVDDLERALAADSHATAVHYPLAMAYRALGQQDKAAAHLRQRGGTFPEMDDALLQDNDVLDSAIAYEDRGMQALKSGDFPAAAEAFRKGLALDPEAASLRYWLGAALYAGGDAAGAEREFSAVAKRSPEFAKAHFSLGAIYDASGRRREAIDEYPRGRRSGSRSARSAASPGRRSAKRQATRGVRRSIRSGRETRSEDCRGVDRRCAGADRSRPAGSGGRMAVACAESSPGAAGTRAIAGAAPAVSSYFRTPSTTSPSCAAVNWLPSMLATSRPCRSMTTVCSEWSISPSLAKACTPNSRQTR